MKLLLINPRDNYASLNSTLNDYIIANPVPFVTKIPSLSLLTIAGLTPSEIEIEYVDECVGDIDFDQPADLIGIGGMTHQIFRAYEIADEFRKRGRFVVIGGIHASVLPDEARAHADAVFIGEAEETWPRFLSDFRGGRAGEFYRGGFVDMARSPIPRYELVNSFDFSGCNRAFVPIQFTRGCPRGCSFCAVTHMYGKKFRTKTVTQILDEIRTIMNVCRFENMTIMFTNDNPFLSKKFATEFLEGIAPLKIKWFSVADISVAKEMKILRLLKKAGCVNLGIGFESLNPVVLKDISQWKNRQLAFYEDAIRIINDHGITVSGSFILGFDHDTRDSFRNVRDFVIKNHVLCKYSIITPFPGTAFYEKMKKEGRLLKEVEWRYYNFLNAVFQTAMPRDEIETELCRLYRETWCDEVMGEIMRFNSKILSA